MNSSRRLIHVAAVIGAVVSIVTAVVVVGSLVDAADGQHETPIEGNAGEQQALTDGEHVGRIIASYVAPDEVVFRPAELLVGEAAQEALAADGLEPSDFYVRDPGLPQTAVPVRRDVIVTSVSCTEGCQEGWPSDYDSLTLTADGSGLHRVTVDGGEIVRIDEIYLP